LKLKRKNNDEFKPKDRYAWLKRIGWAGFFFFLIKGLIWLAVFFGLFKWME